MNSKKGLYRERELGLGILHTWAYNGIGPLGPTHTNRLPLTQHIVDQGRDIFHDLLNYVLKFWLT